eukprot:m.505770 g.505770  ORF g.505770 m.505770 type:complete len:273 (-) comp21865_c0_seq13:1604-2422(-)
MWSAGKPLLSHALGYLMRSQVRTAAFLRPEKHVKYVILGGGVSGGYAMDAFDAHGCSSDVLMISSEKYAPYERPALTKGFLAAGNPVRLPSFHTCAGSGDAAHDAAWYRPPRFDHGLMLGTSVDEFDAASKRLVLDLGTSIVYDKLIIATGASARKANFDNLGADHLVYVRDLNDAEGLYQRLQQLAGRADAAVAIIGGGFIGTEVAAAVAGFGISGIGRALQLSIQVESIFSMKYCRTIFKIHGPVSVIASAILFSTLVKQKSARRKYFAK